MRLTSLFLAFGLFAACQTEGVGISEIDAGIDADEGTGIQRGSEGRTTDAGIPGDTKVATPDSLPATPDSLPTVSPDTLPPKDTLNLDAMTRTERCATTQPAIYTYAWTTACADLVAWQAVCQNSSTQSTVTDLVKKGNNEDCAWTYCVFVAGVMGAPIGCSK